MKENLEAELETELKKAEKVQGLADYIKVRTKYHRIDWSRDGRSYLADLRVSPEEKAGCFIVDTAQWPDFHLMSSGLGGGTECSVKIYAFRSGKSAESDKIVYRHRLNPSEDDWSKAYSKIKDFKLEDNCLKVTVASNEKEEIFTFPLKL